MTTIDEQTLRDLCLSFPGANEDYPFGRDTRVFKVMGKLYAMQAVGATPPSINLKCDPERAILLRETYDAVKPGYHMNKRHWNTMIIDGSMPDEEVLALVRHSYELVVKGLRKAQRDYLRDHYGG